MPRNSKEVAMTQEIAEACGKLLYGKGPDVQGAVLAELLSIFIAGFPEHMREEVLTFHIEHMRPLIAVNAAIIRGEPPPH